jgi:hypothetical protein
MFVLAENVAAVDRAMFVVRDFDHDRLVVTAERLEQLRSAKVMRRLQGTPVGVLPAAVATDSPELPHIEAPRYFEGSE